MSTWKLACLSAVTDGVPRRSLYFALVVGTVLNLINQGDAILAMASLNWLKVVLTYCVPYGVCTYGHFLSTEIAGNRGTLMEAWNASRK